jgi:hypothetical protein
MEVGVPLLRLDAVAARDRRPLVEDNQTGPSSRLGCLGLAQVRDHVRLDHAAYLVELRDLGDALVEPSANERLALPCRASADVATSGRARFDHPERLQAGQPFSQDRARYPQLRPERVLRRQPLADRDPPVDDAAADFLGRGIDERARLDVKDPRERRVRLRSHALALAL